MHSAGNTCDQTLLLLLGCAVAWGQAPTRKSKIEKNKNLPPKTPGLASILGIACRILATAPHKFNRALANTIRAETLEPTPQAHRSVPPTRKCTRTQTAAGKQLPCSCYLPVHAGVCLPFPTTAHHSCCTRSAGKHFRAPARTT